MRPISLLLAALLSLSVASSARAQAFPMYDSVAWGLSQSAGYAILSNNTIKESARAAGHELGPADLFKRNSSKKDGEGKAESPKTDTRLAKPTDMAGVEVLVEGFPDAQKPQMRKAFEGLVSAFEQVAQKLDVPAYDIGSAAAALVSGSYAAYHNTTLGDDHFKPLVEQMQRAMAADPKYASLSSAEKQKLYQIMVGSGMFFTVMQLENAKAPDPQATALLQKGGAEFLENFMGVPASSVVIDHRGISTR